MAKQKNEIIDKKMTEDILVKQNEIIISLLAESKKNLIKGIVTKNKKNPKEYLKGYNSCDGTKGVTELAKIINVKQPTLTPILKSWKEENIIFNFGTKSKPLYKGLLKIK